MTDEAGTDPWGFLYCTSGILSLSLAISIRSIISSVPDTFVASCVVGFSNVALDLVVLGEIGSAIGFLKFREAACFSGVAFLGVDNLGGLENCGRSCSRNAGMFFDKRCEALRGEFP